MQWRLREPSGRVAVNGICNILIIGWNWMYKWMKFRWFRVKSPTATAEIYPLAQMKLLYVSSETVSRRHGWNQRSP